MTTTTRRHVHDFKANAPHDPLVLCVVPGCTAWEAWHVTDPRRPAVGHCTLNVWHEGPCAVHRRPVWRCGNRGCTHPFSRSWHQTMTVRIYENAGPRAQDDFERAHPPTPT